MQHRPAPSLQLAMHAMLNAQLLMMSCLNIKPGGPHNLVKMNESREVTWLKKVLHPTALSEDEPKPKRVKVSDIHQSLETNFTPSTYSHHAVASFIACSWRCLEKIMSGSR